jgi:hypothetical protein
LVVAGWFLVIGKIVSVKAVVCSRVRQSIVVFIFSTPNSRLFRHWPFLLAGRRSFIGSYPIFGDHRPLRQTCDGFQVELFWANYDNVRSALPEDQHHSRRITRESETSTLHIAQ